MVESIYYHTVYKHCHLANIVSKILGSRIVLCCGMAPFDVL
jgi:hypothetical protein